MTLQLQDNQPIQILHAYLASQAACDMQLSTQWFHLQGVCVYPYMSIHILAFWMDLWLYYLARLPLIQGRYSMHLPFPGDVLYFILREVGSSHVRYWDIGGCSIRERPWNPTPGRCGSFISLYIFELIDWMMIITINIPRLIRHMMFVLRVANRCWGYSRNLNRHICAQSGKQVLEVQQKFQQAGGTQEQPCMAFWGMREDKWHIQACMDKVVEVD